MAHLEYKVTEQADRPRGHVPWQEVGYLGLSWGRHIKKLKAILILLYAVAILLSVKCFNYLYGVYPETFKKRDCSLRRVSPSQHYRRCQLPVTTVR